MSDTESSPIVTPPAAAHAKPGYFNQAQLDDLDLAELILASARSNAAALDEQDITAAYLEGFAAHVVETRTRASESGQGKEDAKAATELAGTAATHLFTALQQIQSAAKQKHKMLAEDGDPETNFPTDGYLIGVRLNGSRANLLQNAATLILRIKADNLPGFKTPEKIAAVETLLANYKGKESDQTTATRDKEITRLDRDDLIHILNTRRSSIQHAADALWPWSIEANRPIRKTFALPLNRPLGM
jgi:hypothetical protein